MKRSDKEFVLNLAEESARLDEFDYFLLDQSAKQDPSEIAGWNSEVSPFIIRSIQKFSPSSRISKRKSTSEPVHLSSRSIIPQISPTERRRSFRKQKLPIITPKVLIPKFHFVHAPFNLNLSSRKILNESQISLSAKISESSSPVKATRGIFFSSDCKKPGKEKFKSRSNFKVSSALE